MAKPAPDPFVKRKLEEESNINKHLKTDNENSNDSPTDRIKSKTTPLWKMPYSNQVRDFSAVLIEDIKVLLHCFSWNSSRSK